LHRATEGAAEYAVPADVNAAIDAGDAQAVQKLLTPLPGGCSKALYKKLVKSAEVQAKKLAKGGGAAATPKADAKSTAAASAPKPSAAKPSAAASAPPADVPPPAGTSRAEESLIVADLLTCMRSLALPREVLAALEGQHAVLCQSIAPALNGVRNQAYAEGFAAKA
jgi:hypothetical protein|tara:strand:+ start:2292 stop:2792 length:501 start_codon:yes stop_codon:yes gene_type:complete